MTGRTSGLSLIRKPLALLMCLALAIGAAPGVFAQDPTATIAGIILDPSGKPAFGFKAVVIDTVPGVGLVAMQHMHVAQVHAAQPALVVGLEDQPAVRGGVGHTEQFAQRLLYRG